MVVLQSYAVYYHSEQEAVGNLNSYDVRSIQAAMQGFFGPGSGNRI